MKIKTLTRSDLGWMNLSPHEWPDEMDLDANEYTLRFFATTRDGDFLFVSYSDISEKNEVRVFTNT